MKLWLDLELRKDIDDVMTLIYALETNKNIKYISINNPSFNEIVLLNLILQEFHKEDIKLYYSGEITSYEEVEDIHKSLKEYFFTKNYFNLNKYINSFTHISQFEGNLSDFTIFCGGSLTTLSILLKEHNLNSVIQGGYAGEIVVGKENVLKKFKNRKSVPSWNLNLDEIATDYVLNSLNLNKCIFISKNVCHNSWLSISDLENKEKIFFKILNNYFLESEFKSKCMHDLVAFMSLFHSNYLEFKKVFLFSEKKELSFTKYFSEEDKNSNKEISISLNMEIFKENLNLDLKN